MVYTLRFFLSLKCNLFHNSNLFGACIIHILYTECAKIKKNNSGAKTCYHIPESQTLRACDLEKLIDMTINMLKYKFSNWKETAGCKQCR